MVYVLKVLSWPARRVLGLKSCWGSMFYISCSAFSPTGWSFPVLAPCFTICTGLQLSPIHSPHISTLLSIPEAVLGGLCPLALLPSPLQLGLAVDWRKEES